MELYIAWDTVINDIRNFPNRKKKISLKRKHLSVFEIFWKMMQIIIEP